MVSTTARDVSSDVLDVNGIARLLGVSRQRVYKLIERDDFPAPAAVLTAGRIWKREAVEQWARETGRIK